MEYAHTHEAFFRKYLELPSGIPSHDTFNRVFAIMDASVLEENYQQWIKQFQLRFAENLAYTEDECFTYCYLGLAKSIKLVHTRLYHYVQHAGSVMKDSFQMALRADDAIRDLLKFYCRQGCFSKMQEVFSSRFVHCYNCAEKYTPTNQKSSMQRREYQLLTKAGLINRKENYVVRTIASRQLNWFARWFCKHVGNRVCYGVGGISLCSITYEQEKRIYRILGKIISVRNKDGNTK